MKPALLAWTHATQSFPTPSSGTTLAMQVSAGGVLGLPGCSGGAPVDLPTTLYRAGILLPQMRSPQVKALRGRPDDTALGAAE